MVDIGWSFYLHLQVVATFRSLAHWPRKASSSLPLSSVRDIVMTSCDTGSSTLFACLTFFPVVERCCDKLPGPNPVPGCHPCKSKRNCGTVVLELCGQNSGKGAVISLAGASPSDIRTLYMSLCWDPDILWGLVVLLLLGSHQENLGTEVSLWKLDKSCEVCNHLFFAIQ